MRAAILAALVIATAPAITAPAMAQPGHKTLGAGNWYGTGLQVGPDGVQSTWTIEMTIGARNGAIAYPSLGCKGTLEQVRRTDSQVEYVETITEGNCFTGGRINARLENGRLFWFWTKPGAGADASAVLYPGGLVS